MANKYKITFIKKDGRVSTKRFKTKKEAEDIKSKMIDSNKLHRSVNYPIGYKNPRISKI